MTIAFDAATNGGFVDPGTSLTYSHTCTGSDLILFVFVLKGGTDDTITGVTYGGVAMTRDARVTNASVSAGESIDVYSLVAPATGANNVVISSSASRTIVSNAHSYTGAQQTGQPDATNTGTSTGDSLTVSVTTVANNSWLVGAFRNDVGANTPGANTTERHEQGALATTDSNAAMTPAGSYSQSMSFVSAGDSMGVVVSFKPVAASGPANLKSLNTNLKANIKTINTNLLANIKSLNTNV